MEPESTAQHESEPALSAWNWHLHLLFRPRSFFRHFAVRRLPILVAACAWLYGMAGVIDRVEMNMLQGKSQPWVESWAAYWGFVLGAGAVGGLLYYWIGGWWYRQRLMLSGDRNPDAKLAKRVYLYASQVIAIPTLFLTAFASTQADSPIEAFHSDLGLWDTITMVVSIVALFWSVATSYIGVRTLFAVQSGKALLWFAILPIVAYTIFIGILIVTAVGSGAFVDKRPDLENARTWENSVVTFQHPGNWEAQAQEVEEASFSVTLEGMPDALIELQAYPSEDTPATELAATLEGLAQNEKWREADASTSFGTLRGAGAGGRFTTQNTPVEVRVFVCELRAGSMLEVTATWARSDEAHVLPVLELLEDTLRVK